MFLSASMSDIDQLESHSVPVSVDFDIPVSHNSLNDIWKEHEELLNKWKYKLFVQLWLQENSMHFYAQLNNWITYPIIVISSISSATLFSTNSVPIKYTVACMSLVTGILTAISRQMRPAELYQQHASATLRYMSLLRMIDTYLSLPQNLREEHPTVFMKRIETDIATLMETQINAPPIIKQKFEKKFGSIDRLVYGEEIMALLKQSLTVKRGIEKEKRNNKGQAVSGYVYASTKGA